jgi:NhaP-type Na+/H+ or K+/H+ antiporter
MLFAGSINVKARTLGEEKWVVMTLAIGATLIAATLIGGGLWGLFDRSDRRARDPWPGWAPAAARSGETLFNDGGGGGLFTIALTVVQAC